MSGSEFSFLLQRDKTDTWYEGNRVLIQCSLLSSDPLALFQCYLVSRDLHFPLHPYLWLRADGHPPTRSWFIRRLRLFFPANVSGHFMRAGGATSLAATGVSPDQIQAIGRWRSGTWERYVRKNATLLQALLFHGRPIHDPPFANV
jgi:hypothetical protein